MTWMIVGGSALASAVVGAAAQHESAAAQQRQKKAEMMANAAQIQYSPWTGAKAQIMGNDAKDPGAAAIAGGLQGGVAGAMMGSQFKNAGGAAPATPGTPEVPTTELAKPALMQPASVPDANGNVNNVASYGAQPAGQMQQQQLQRPMLIARK